MKPRVVLSHDGPQAFIEAGFGIRDRSRTRQALQAAYELWQPKIWVFGHHHLRREFDSRDGTLFVCLGELDHLDIDLPPRGGEEGRGGTPWCTEEEALEERVGVARAAVQGVLHLSDARAALLARVCLQNGGRLSKRKWERHFAELTEEQVMMVEGALAELAAQAQELGMGY